MMKPQSAANVPMTKCASAALGYGIAVAILRRVVSAALQQLTSGVPPKRRSRAELYVLSTMNCATCVAVALKVLAERSSKDEKQRSEWECRIVTQLGKLELGYYTHDLLAILPSWREHPSDILHHLCGLVMMLLTLGRLDSLHSFVAPLLMVDASTIVLNMLWFQREFEIRTASTKPLEVLFVSMFFVLRVVWLPVYLYRKRRDEPEKFFAVGPVGETTLGCIVALQLYWFLLIAKKFLLSK